MKPILDNLVNKLTIESFANELQNEFQLIANQRNE